MADSLSFEKPQGGLLREVLEAHGGFERWDTAQTVRLRMTSGGWAFRMRFCPYVLKDAEVKVFLKDQRVEIRPYPKPGQMGLYEKGVVKILGEDGQVVAESTQPRKAFGTLRRKIYWDAIDCLYFSGYALWNYLSAPYLLTMTDAKLTEEEPWTEKGETWQRLKVVYPEGFHTHSREQIFYFGDDRRLRRHDYTAEPFGNWAKAAHYCSEYSEDSGAVFPMRRRVVPRRANNKPMPFPLLVWVDVHSVEMS